jgi:D-alanine-D-alanine ligase-like ATP-grasp enzyme
MDLRLDAEGRPRVIDVNPNPDLTPDDGLTSTSGMARAVLSAGWSWADFIRFQVEIAR